MSARATPSLKIAGRVARLEKFRLGSGVKVSATSLVRLKQPSIKASYGGGTYAPNTAISEFRPDGTLSTGELETLRWELVQKSWDQSLSPSESLNLRFVEARLDAEDRAKNEALVAARLRLRDRQEALLSSMEDVISLLRK